MSASGAGPSATTRSTGGRLVAGVLRDRRSGVQDDILRGALAGCVGTAVMSAAMAAAKAAGMMAGELPPRKVAGNLEEAAGLREELSRPVFEASWVGQHFAYGVAAGVVYALAQR